MAGVADFRFGTFLKLLGLLAVPIVPTMIELGGWSAWPTIPGTTRTFPLLYTWAGIVSVSIMYQLYARTQRTVQWQAYWTERARTLGGNMEQAGKLFLLPKGDDRRPSSEQVTADLLRQIVDVVRSLTDPPPGVHIMSCMLVPVCDETGPGARPDALQATTYNENAGRNHSRIPLSAPGPACEAYHKSRTSVVADTTKDPYREQFKGRPYKSVVAFPVNIGHGDGRRLAVVTIDATEAGIFTDEIVEKKGIEAAIFPYLKLIGLTRIAEQKGGARGNKGSRNRKRDSGEKEGFSG